MEENQKFYNVVGIPGQDPFIDLTKDDALKKDVKRGKWFHLSTGERVQGENDYTVDASKATATVDLVLDTFTFGKGSEMQTGTMPNRSGMDVIITSKDGTTIPTGYFTGLTKAKLSDEDLKNLISANIKEGVRILGVDGSYGADDFSSTAKEVDPTFEDKTYLPSDDGFTFFSSFKVNAIKVTETENKYGGITVTIGA